MDDTVADAVNTVENLLVGEDGLTKVVLDYMVEHLAVMAETGRLTYGQDYVVRETYGDIVIRFDACHAEYRRYHRETQLDSELLNAKAYRKQAKENYDRGGYVTEVRALVRIGKGPKRVIILDLKRAEKLGIDLDGFRGNEESGHTFDGGNQK